MGWMMVSGEIKGKKEGKAFAAGMNLSLVGSKVDGEWKIAAMHYSTVAGEKAASNRITLNPHSKP